MAEAVLSDDARVRVLTLEREPFDALASWVEEVESFWGAQLSSFKAYAEQTRAKRGRQ